MCVCVCLFACLCMCVCARACLCVFVCLRVLDLLYALVLRVIVSVVDLWICLRLCAIVFRGDLSVDGLWTCVCWAFGCLGACVSLCLCACEL